MFYSRYALPSAPFAYWDRPLEALAKKKKGHKEQFSQNTQALQNAFKPAGKLSSQGMDVLGVLGKVSNLRKET